MKGFIYCTIVFLLCSTKLVFPTEFDKKSLNLILKNNSYIQQNNEPINFNFVRLGQNRTKNFFIENVGRTSYSIEKILFQKGGLNVFLFVSSPKIPAIINPNQSINITLTFQPDRVGSFYDTLLIYFVEPFNFVYSLPIEGHSLCLNTLFIKDTSDFVGTKDFKLPIFIKGDPNLVEALPINFSFLVTSNSKIFYIDSIRNGIIVSKTSKQTYTTYKISLNNFLLDSYQKPICYLIGKLYLSQQDTTIITISEPQCEVAGVDFETVSGILSTYGICITNLSIVDFDYFSINIPDIINTEELKIFFNQNYEIETWTTIKIYNLLGKEVQNLTLKISNEVSIPLSYISSGIYKVDIQNQYQKYSKIICVYK